MATVQTMQEDTKKRLPCCGLQNDITGGAICAQTCNTVSKTWKKGNVLFRCELYKEALNAYDIAYETWPWVRTRRKGSRTARDPPSNGASKKEPAISAALIRWFFQLY